MHGATLKKNYTVLDVSSKHPYRSNIFVLYSALLHASAVHISHHQVGIGSLNNKKGRGLF
jgi:hypothetical protein